MRLGGKQVWDREGNRVGPGENQECNWGIALYHGELALAL